MGVTHDKNTAAVREYFDRIASEFRTLDFDTVDKLLSTIPLKKSECALDVACGVGVLDACLLKRGLPSTQSIYRPK